MPCYFQVPNYNNFLLYSYVTKRAPFAGKERTIVAGNPLYRVNAPKAEHLTIVNAYCEKHLPSVLMICAKVFQKEFAYSRFTCANQQVDHEQHINQFYAAN